MNTTQPKRTLTVTTYTPAEWAELVKEFYKRHPKKAKRN